MAQTYDIWDHSPLHPWSDVWWQDWQQGREREMREHQSFQYSFLIIAPPMVGEWHFALGIASLVDVGGDRCMADIGM